MNILVTGGAGYIGSVLVPRLLRDKHRVTVLDSFMYGQTPLLEVCADPNLEVIRGDVRDGELLAGLVSKADAIIPLAALVGAPLCKKDPITSDAVNRDVVIRIAEMKSKHQMLVYPCTNSGYGIGQDGIHCDEESPLKPISLYGRQKVEAEKHLLDSGEAVTFRLATVFGISPRMRLDLLVNDFTYRALNDGAVVLFEAHFKRNYLHVRDAAEVFVHALENYGSMKGRAYNVGLDEANLSKEELCEAIRKRVPSFTYVISEIGEDPDKRNYIVSNERLAKAGFRAKVSLDEGIQELLRGYQILRRTQFSNV